MAVYELAYFTIRYLFNVSSVLYHLNLWKPTQTAEYVRWAVPFGPIMDPWPNVYTNLRTHNDTARFTYSDTSANEDNSFRNHIR